MDDPRVFQGQRHRRVCLGPQRDFSMSKSRLTRCSRSTRDGVETVIAMKKQPDDEILDNFHFRRFQQSEQVKTLLSLRIQDTVQKRANFQITPDCKILWFGAWNRKCVSSIISWS